MVSVRLKFRGCGRDIVMRGGTVERRIGYILLCLQLGTRETWNEVGHWRTRLGGLVPMIASKPKRFQLFVSDKVA